MTKIVTSTEGDRNIKDSGLRGSLGDMLSERIEGLSVAEMGGLFDYTRPYDTLLPQPKSKRPSQKGLKYPML